MNSLIEKYQNNAPIRLYLGNMFNCRCAVFKFYARKFAKNNFYKQLIRERKNSRVLYIFPLLSFELFYILLYTLSQE